MNAALKRVGRPLLPILACILLWETFSQAKFLHPLLFPPPSTVLRALWELLVNGTLFADTAASMWRVMVGLSIGVVTGVILGILAARVESINRVVSPVIQALRPLPPVALIPLIIVWFGIGDTAKIFSIVLASFFPVWLSTYTGARQMPEEFLWSAELLTDSRLSIFLRIIFPASLPFIVAGIRTAIATAFIMIFVSELAGAESGLGYRISITQLAYRVDQMIAGLIVLSFLSFMTDCFFIHFTKRVFPWLTC